MQVEESQSIADDLWIGLQKLTPLAERGQAGKGANLSLFCGANMAMCSRRKKRVRLSFPGSFSLVRFFWRSKRNEHQKKEGCLFEPPCTFLLP